MDINLEKGTIIIFGKSSKLSTIISKFSSLSGEQAYSFFTNRGIQIPRLLNVMALRSVINDRIKWVNSNTLSKDYFQRLKYYPHFTEQQLFNLYMAICNDDESFQLYRENLFRLVLLNFVALDLKDGEINYIKTLKKARTEPFEQYFNFISGACLEQDDTFDGINTDELREYLPLSASNQEIVDLAAKYGIDLPIRLTKEQMLQYIYDYMQKNNTYSDEIKEELDKMTLQQLTTYSKRTGINMEPQMTKEELVTYLFWYLEQCTIAKTSVRRIEADDLYNPLQFEVDLTQINIFGNGRGKRLIKYDGMFDDTQKWNQIQDGTYNKPEPKKEDIEEEKEDAKDISLEEKVEVIDDAKEEVKEDLIEEVKEDVKEEVIETPKTNEVAEVVQPVNEGLDATTIHGEENTLDTLTEEVKREQKEKEEIALRAKAIKEEQERKKAQEISDKKLEDIIKNDSNQKLEDDNEDVIDAHGLKVDEDFASTQAIDNDKYGSESLIGIGNGGRAKVIIAIIIIILLIGAIGFLAYWFFLKDMI